MPEPSSPPTSPQYVPYQAYKPKRHSRNFSTHSAAGSRPTSAAVSPVASPRPLLHPEEDKDPVPALSLLSPSVQPSSPSLAGRYMDSLSQPRTGTPTIRVEAFEPPSQHCPTPDTAKSLPIEPIDIKGQGDPRPRTAGVVEFPVNTSSPSPSSSMPPSPSSSSQAQPSPSSQLSPLPRKVSTFRRLTPRPSAPSSPLAGQQHQRLQSPTSHSRSVSAASLPAPATKSSEPRDWKALPSTGSQAFDRSRTASNPNIPATTTVLVVKDLPATPGATLSQLQDFRPSVSQAPTLSKSISHSSSTSNGNGTASLIESRSQTASPFHKFKSAPYPQGFQPKGASRHLTDEFLSLRRRKRDGEGDAGRMKRIEKTKLERRFEKLVNLHFPTPGSAEEKEQKLRQKAPDHRSMNRRASSFFDFDSIRSKKLDAGDLWRGVVTGNQDKARDIRAAEQRITPWEEDNTVSKCPLCQASFHPLTCRKHHCRLCGKIVCSLPPKPPQRPVTCSLLFVVDSKTRQIEEVGEGVDYGVKRKKAGARQEAEDKFLQGIRICRECRPVLLRQQYLNQAEDAPPFHKLYHILLSLEQEIEGSLPQFQELLVTFNDQPSKEALAARRRLLDSFAQYDKLSKQIRALPTKGGPGSSQDRVQSAIQARASSFLQKNMFPLQFLPKPSSSKGQPNDALNEASQETASDLDSVLARTLQPLLEQETLLETFIEEAKAQRKFEDVKTLKSNYAEIRREIEKVIRDADLQGR
ncbi:hypothetical protein DFP72DRAFT_870078 [Ephemerocybe angulata]|uniref:FYVE-type domain-containing protein n=1 Tax=Ephemerocybe angulata TaxID=980116 RepID=A0A8H6IJ03_9AGAR|nr:hypothetical protein DFP72DRAFT_870078 [Tulosesus angulatus]